MAIVVEDGTGKADAESYIDATFLETFCESWGLDLPADSTTEAVEAALRRGTLVFDSVYGTRFPGLPVTPAQALIFPMTGLVDRRGYVVPNFPVQVKQAAAILSRQELVTPMSMFPTVDVGRRKKSVTVDTISVEYDYSGVSLGSVGSARPVLSIVDGILAPILTTPSTYAGALYGSAVRA